jgi:hypothetical protein
VLILIRNVDVISDWFAGLCNTTCTKEHEPRSTLGITSFSETQKCKRSLLQWDTSRSCYEQGQLEGGERAGDRQTEEIALALVPEPADGPTPSQMRQD